MCSNKLTVDACVGIRTDCPIDYLLTPDTQAEFSFGGKRNGFHLAFDVGALRAFLLLGAAALGELESRVAHEAEATITPKGTSELVTIGGPST